MPKKFNGLMGMNASGDWRGGGDGMSGYLTHQHAHLKLHLYQVGATDCNGSLNSLQYTGHRILIFTFKEYECLSISAKEAAAKARSDARKASQSAKKI